MTKPNDLESILPITTIDQEREAGNDTIVDHSTDLSWDDIDTPLWANDSKSVAKIIACELTESSTGKPQIRVAFRFLNGPNRGQTTNTWLTIQAVSAKQLRFLQQDLKKLFGGDSMKRFSSLDAIVKHMESSVAMADSVIGGTAGVSITLRNDSPWPRVFIRTDNRYKSVDAWVKATKAVA